MAQAQMTGAEQVAARMRSVGRYIREHAEEVAVREGGKVFQLAMVERTPELTGKTPGSDSLAPGAMRADIKVRVVKDELGTAAAYIGPTKKTARVARWVEFGHRLVKGGYLKFTGSGMKMRGKGKQFGEVPAHPFLRPAYEASEQSAMEAVRESLRVSLAEAVKRG